MIKNIQIPLIKDPALGRKFGKFKNSKYGEFQHDASSISLKKYIMWEYLMDFIYQKQLIYISTLIQENITVHSASLAFGKAL